MLMSRCLCLFFLTTAAECVAQKPVIFDVAPIVVGEQKLETLYFLAEGKWSDSDADIGGDSINIHCYKRFTICEVAEASTLDKQAWVRLTTFDILRWDTNEMIAVDT